MRFVTGVILLILILPVVSARTIIIPVSSVSVSANSTNIDAANITSGIIANARYNLSFLLAVNSSIADANIANASVWHAKAGTGSCSAGQYVSATNSSGVVCSNLSASVEYPATSVITTIGTAAGNVSGLLLDYDGLYYNVTENSPNGIEFYINFSGVVNFTDIHVNDKYDGGASHSMILSIYDYNLSSWVSIITMGAESSFSYHTWSTSNPSRFISGGVVRVRYTHSGVGVASHVMSVDHISVNYNPGGSGGVDTNNFLQSVSFNSSDVLTFERSGLANLTRSINGAVGWNRTADNTSTSLRVAINNNSVIGSLTIRNGSAQHFFINGSSGFVGVGTAAPRYTLHTTGTSYATIATGSNIIVYPSSTNARTVATMNSGGLDIASGIINSPRGGFGMVNNLLNYSQQFDSGTWRSSGINMTANSTFAPDTSLTAYLLNATTAGGNLTQGFYFEETDYMYIRVTFYVRSVSGTTNVSLRIQCGDTFLQDVLTGYEGISTSWERQSSANVQCEPGGPVNVTFYPGRVNGTGAVYLWGMQVASHLSSSLLVTSPYSRTTNGPVYAKQGAVLNGHLFISPSASDVGQAIRLAQSTTNNAWELQNPNGSIIDVFTSAGYLGLGTGSPSYPLTVNVNYSGVSGWFQANVSAAGYITRTDVYDVTKQGAALSKIKPSSAYFASDGAVNHSAFDYSAVSYKKRVLDYYAVKNKTERVCETVDEEIKCFNVTKTIKDPVFKEIVESGVDLGREVALIKQATYELNQRVNCLRTMPDKDEVLC